MAAAVEHISGPRETDAGVPVLVCLLRDGEPWLEAWLDHYRELGCEQMVLLDNGSRDRTLDLLAGRPEVAVWRCPLPFAQHKRAMRRWLVRRFAHDRWCLCVDVDELFDWPRSLAPTLAALVRRLEARACGALVAQMLELFPETLADGDETGFSDKHRFYDLDAIHREPYDVPGNELTHAGVQTFHGGIRATLFGFRPWLTKHPLFFAGEDVLPYYDDSHRVEAVRIADLTGVLRHYKFAGDFRGRVERAVREANYWQDSVEYRHYAAALASAPELRFLQPTSREWHGPDRLLDQGFLVAAGS